MTLEDKVHGFRLHLFRRAQELRNVSAACRECGVSRSLYYQLRGRFQRYGADDFTPHAGSWRISSLCEGFGWRRARSTGPSPPDSISP